VSASSVDVALLEAARAGDADALERVLQLWRPNLLRYAALNCRAADAEDAVQESLLIVLRQMNALRSVGAFASWLFQIVKRECLRLTRRQAEPERIELEDVENLSALSMRDEIDLRLDIALAIQSLPDLYRDVIVLRDFGELTMSEIAQRLGLQGATVKTRIRRGRQLIREHLLT
jgi:RNA polymerase sigma-70 factor (ECF subfamily)